MLQEQDSLNLVVEMPQEQRKRHTTVIPNWQFSKTCHEYNQVKLFICANEVYIRNLMAGKEEAKIKEGAASKMSGKILLQQGFELFLKTTNGNKDQFIEMAGEIDLLYSSYKGMKLVVIFNNFEANYRDYFVARFMILDKEDKRSKTFKFDKDEYNSWSCFIEDSELDALFLNRLLAFEIEFVREVQQEVRYVGLRNEGNTCYMNSILQILYFIRPVRKMIVEYQGEGKTILALKDIFIRLIDGPESRTGAVDAQELIEAYGRFADFPRRQQDTQQFLIGFLEELEGECAALASLWSGQSQQCLESRQQQKPYKSVQKEDFNGLDLPLQDFKGNTFGQIIDSLHFLLLTEHVDDKIQTDDYGKVSVNKNRSFSSIPPIIFLTLKRYQFKKNQARPTKIMADLHYPPRINLSFLYGTATGEDMEYQLFALTVHKGQHYNSGHYYSFINTSDDLSEPYWVKFDDSRVHLASEDQVLNFSGGKKKMMGWNVEFERFMEKQFTAQDTAYVLVYFKRQAFREYQKIDVPIPKEWFQKKRKNKASQTISQEHSLFQVQVLVAEFSTEPQIFFGQSLETIPLGLDPSKEIITQLKNFSGSFLGCKVGSVWKVHKADEKMKKMKQFSDLPQTTQRVFDPKRGHRIPDYLLIVPDKTPVFSTNQNQKFSSQGLVQTHCMTEEGIIDELHLIKKESLADFATQKQKKYKKKADIKIESQEDFQLDWNDYLNIVFQ